MKGYPVIILALFFCGVLNVRFGFQDKTIEYLIHPFPGEEAYATEALPVNFPDSIILDSIYLLRSETGFPAAYYCDILTTVCSDQECLPVNMRLYWTSTGAYLGFKLPFGFPLTKKDHIPFTPDEYSALNNLLADRESVLSEYKIEELVVRDTSIQVDGISSATNKAIQDVTINGAVYTCHQLWHVVNGAIASFISAHTQKEITPAFALKLAENGRTDEITWLLDHVNLSDSSYNGLKQKLATFIATLDYSVSSRILSSLTSTDLKDSVIQHSLLTAYTETTPEIQKIILETLCKAEDLNDRLFSYFSLNLSKIKSYLMPGCLQLLSKQSRIHPATYECITGLLEGDNNFLISKALLFLQQTSEVNNKSKSLLSDYYQTTETGQKDTPQ
ncbi:MAG: hypothetical protein ACK5M7_17585 [Draconibacterium sp.]